LKCACCHHSCSRQQVAREHPSKLSTIINIVLYILLLLLFLLRPCHHNYIKLSFTATTWKVNINLFEKWLSMLIGHLYQASFMGCSGSRQLTNAEVPLLFLPWRRVRHGFGRAFPSKVTDGLFTCFADDVFECSGCGRASFRSPQRLPKREPSRSIPIARIASRQTPWASMGHGATWGGAFWHSDSERKR
jgi:hypothetical protein